MDAEGSRITGRGGRRRMWCLVLGAVAVVLVSAAAGVSSADDGSIQFNRDIRPILSENCLACHGPDARRRSAGLRLDLEQGAKSPLESGAHAIVPGNIEESELLRRVVSRDPADQMPPPETGKSLTAAQVEILKQWVAQGAPWESHWAFRPIRRPAPPALVDDEFIRNPIDTFVLQSLRDQQLKPAAPADRVTLLRRISTDLVGLPPAPAEVDAFLADDGPLALESAVDRWLASPRFGERMAIGWLDLVRYADSVGLFADQSVRVSPYRDYVIESFNRNLPFDRFTIEQLAGDLLPECGEQQKIAVAYNRLGRMSTESGVQEKEYLAKYIAERVRNVGSTWLGLTLGCCECHDHKYDPLTSRDFYQFAAFFADIKERGVYDKDSPFGIDFGPNLQLGTPAQLAERVQVEEAIAEVDREIEELKEFAQSPSGDSSADQRIWEDRIGATPSWVPLDVESVVSAGNARSRISRDESIVMWGPLPEKDRYVIRGRVPPGHITAVRLEVLTADSLPGDGPGRGAEGNFVLTNFTAIVDSAASSGSLRAIPFQSATATYEQVVGTGETKSRRWNAAASIGLVREPGVRGWSVGGRNGTAQHAIFETQADVWVGPGDVLVFELDQAAGEHLTLGRFRLSVTSAPRPVATVAYDLPRELQDILVTHPWMRSKSDRKKLAEHFTLKESPAAVAINARRKKLIDRRNFLTNNIPSVLTVERVEPRPIRILKRGDWQDDSGEVVSPAFPGFLPQKSGETERLTRLDLAQWLVSRDNPLTARVLVNRLWKMYFGTGLSRQLDDFGAQGEWPTHPELLDWLACELMDSGWDLKHVIRLIVTSGAYRQSTAPSAEARDRDPENRWVSHQSRFRLEAELVRDNALSVSGLLSPKVGGPSVRPYQPDGYWDVLNKPPRTWNESPGDGIYRRGLYTHWQRQFLHPMLQAFDAPSREECTASRPRSATPLQALVLLNDPTFVEAARALAQSSFRRAGDDTDARLDFLFQQVLSRGPSAAERQVLTALVERHIVEYRADSEAALQLLKVGRHPVPTGRLEETAAWTNVARVVLNHQDVTTRN